MIRVVSIGAVVAAFSSCHRPDAGPGAECPPGASRPGAPRNVDGRAGIRSAELSWSPPASDGGCAITGYSVLALPGRGPPTTQQTQQLNALVMGLEDGDNVCFGVSAINAIGQGPSQLSAQAAYPCLYLPDRPVEPNNVNVYPGADSVRVFWTPPTLGQILNKYLAGGFPITGYVVTVSPGNHSLAVEGYPSSTVDVRPLPAGPRYSAAVASVSAVGASWHPTPSSNSGALGEGPWRWAGTLPARVAEHASIAWQGHLFVVGGMNTNTAERPKSAVSAIGADGALGPWVLVPHPPPWPHASIAFAASDNTIGFVYATGGFPAFADVNSARISADGSMAPFSPVGAPMPFDRYSHASTIANGHLYVVGGMSSKSKHFANLSDSVLVAPIDSSSGTLISCGTDCSPWTAATSLPTPRHSLALVESSGHLYAIGGVGDSGPVSELSVATLQPDGTLGPWRPATAQLPLALRAPAAMIANGRLYVIGGLTLTGPPLSTRVLVGHLAPDGDVLSWEDLETDRIIGGRLAHAVASWNGTFVYVSGGAGVEESPLSDVEFARIDPCTGHLLP